MVPDSGSSSFRDGGARCIWVVLIAPSAPIGPAGARCIWVVLIAPSAPIGPAGNVSVPESDPVGSMSLTLDGVVPTL
ncbi:hypothetical protein F2Q70_00029596 [Brassica cretica]|uniref:Uncharacterized protein n=1 Tax=Brassica cretica TaxID=69181 RepID=A0A8S9FD28_BRACR|nr:hypothetical protein F2Q70_00029596 [Brassica cretica]